jgi:hypothetical protein
MLVAGITLQSLQRQKRGRVNLSCKFCVFVQAIFRINKLLMSLFRVFSELSAIYLQLFLHFWRMGLN